MAGVVAVEARGNKWVCYNQSSGHIYGTFSGKDAETEARTQMQAIEKNLKDKKSN